MINQMNIATLSPAIKPVSASVIVGGTIETNPLAVYGTSGNDTLYGKGSNSYVDPGLVYAGDGNDTVWGSSTYDKIFGGNGNDILHGGAGTDWLYGGSGDDLLYGDSGFDYLFGGDGNDWVALSLTGGGHAEGGKGNDSLVSSMKTSFLDGGEGNDHFLVRWLMDGEVGFINGGSGWDVAMLDKAMVGSDAWIEADGGAHVLHWQTKTGDWQEHYVDSIEQFNVGGALYTWDQLLV